MAARVRKLGMEVGLVINPPTPVEKILPHVGGFDLILVMSVNPGFAGQAFIDSALEKTSEIRRHLRPEQRLQMDGGVSPANAARVREAGCDVLVAGSAFFSLPRERWSSVVSSLKTGK